MNTEWTPRRTMRRSTNHMSFLGTLFLAACSEPSSTALDVDAYANNAGVDATAPDLDGGGAPPLDGGHPPSATVRSVPVDCEERGAFAPVLPEEGGHYLAVRLQPSSYPLPVRTVGYRLSDTPDECTAWIAHQVQLYVVDGMTPTSTPSADGTLVRTLDVPWASPPEEPVRIRDVEHSVGEPIVLTAGQSLIVAVRLAVDPDDSTRSLCLRTCLLADPTETTDYSSRAAIEPFDWVDLIAGGDFTDNGIAWASSSPL